MRFKATIVLSLLLLILGGYLYYIEIPSDRKKQEAEIQQKRLYSFTPASITNLTIKNANGETIEFLHDPDHPEDPWRITRPVETIANDAAASMLASQLERLEAGRVVEEKPEALKEFGLDPPVYSVIVTLNRVDTEILEVGSENLTGSEVYVRKGAGTPVYLVPAAIKKSLNKDLRGWRQQEVLHFASTDVKRVQIESPRQQIEIAREGEGWQIKKPIQTKADPTEVSNLLGSLSSLRGEEFIDDRKAERMKAFGPPILKVRLGVAEVEREARFYRLSSEPETVYAVTTPFAPIYKFSAQTLKAIEEPAATYRDKRVVDLSGPVSVEQISIRKKGGALLLEKKEGSWSIQGTPAKKVSDPEKVNGLLSELADLRVARFIDAPPPTAAKVGLTDPEWSIQLKGKEGKLLGEVALGRAEGSALYAQSYNQPGPFLVNKEDTERLRQAAESIKAAEAAPPPPAAAPAPKQEKNQPPG
ncbi:MAG: DUF4340 domain-containing protein [Nitrospirae bacterium]|nr:DUF4340 domain-containing protein [Candidatus Manganitrophaceae bacterium]